MQNNEKPISKNVKDLFTEGDACYEIPVYQRDYAWTEAQIRQLIQDVADYAKEKSDSRYYIGTLIVYERLRDGKTIYETIDGQQRLTTLSILLNLLRNVYKEVPWFEKNILSFACRLKSTESLISLENDGVENVNSENVNPNIIQGYKDAFKALSKILAEYKLNASAFAKYLGENVYILRVPVPKDTDLNHYFEIMNSRGEQLEKHEILKAKCLEWLSDEERVAFNKIWEAASNMERYVQYGFSVKDRDAVFGTDLDGGCMWDSLDGNMDNVYKALKNAESADSEKMSLEEIIENRREKDPSKDKNEEDDSSRFNTVINFSNFLLHVLRIQVGTDIPLDDKRLLELFDPFLSVQSQGETDLDAAKRKIHDFVKQFGYNLLKIKYLYDKYVIKREFSNGDDQWSLKRVRIYDGKKGKKSYSYMGTFSEGANSDDESELNRDILMLLAMFHVSSPTLVYKHWLNGALKWCFEQESISAEAYRDYLRMMAESFLRDRFLAKTPLDYYAIIYSYGCQTKNKNNDTLDFSKLNAGTSVENFIFNYLDYLLWIDFKTDTKSAFDVIGNNQDLRRDVRISNFEFTFRSSVEHYYPQNPIEGSQFKMDDVPLNCFGNLCLISNEKNSRLSNFMPDAKTNFYAASERIDSIKQRIMMAYEEWDDGQVGGKNGQSEIDDHYKKMLLVLLGEVVVSKSETAVVVFNNGLDCGPSLEDDLLEYMDDSSRNRVNRDFWSNKRRIIVIQLDPESVFGEPPLIQYLSTYDIVRDADGSLYLSENSVSAVDFGYAEKNVEEMYFKGGEDCEKMNDEVFVHYELTDLYSERH